MATNHTTNYHLNTWEPGDSFLRSEFNENFNKLDTALKAEADARTAADAQKASAAALNALQTVVNGKGNCRIVVGTYTGTGTYGAAHPTVINIPGVGKPQIVMLGEINDNHVQLLVRDLSNSFYFGNNTTVTTVTWTDSGVKMSCETMAFSQFNKEGKNYLYVAVG